VHCGSRIAERRTICRYQSGSIRIGLGPRDLTKSANAARLSPPARSSERRCTQPDGIEPLTETPGSRAAVSEHVARAGCVHDREEVFALLIYAVARALRSAAAPPAPIHKVHREARGERFAKMRVVRAGGHRAADHNDASRSPSVVKPIVVPSADLTASDRTLAFMLI